MLNFGVKKVTFNLSESNRYVVCVQSVDLRKGLDGLCGMIHYLSLSPTNGDVYVFFNKSRNTIKLLHWESGGFVVYYKRMEQGRVRVDISNPVFHLKKRVHSDMNAPFSTFLNSDFTASDSLLRLQ